jgi:MFS-type transporter involved in bile tolerance (Atg22 family)
MNHFSPEHAGRNFGVLAMVERTSGTIWPLLWILPFTFVADEPTAYRLAMWLMVLLAVVTLGILLQTNRKPT